MLWFRIWSWWILLHLCWVSTFLDIFLKLSISRTSIKNTIFWKSIMRSFRWIGINCFYIFRFLVEVSTNLQKMHYFGNLRTITKERNKEIRQMTPFFSSTFWALTVCEIHFCIWKLLKFIFMGSYFCISWSEKYLNFGSVSCKIRILSSSSQQTYTLKVSATFLLVCFLV